MDINRIKCINFLENTRLIYTGIKTLYQDCRESLPAITDYSNRKNQLGCNVNENWRQHCPQPGTAVNGVDTNIRYHHPLHLFFQFMANEKACLPGITRDQIEPKCIQEITDMLALYDALEQLSYHTENRKYYPERFTWLCNCIRDMMHSDMCYLLYSQRDQSTLLSTSDILVSDDFVPLKKRDFDQIRNMIELRRRRQIREIDSQLLGNTILFDGEGKQKLIPGKNVMVLILDFPRYPYREWKGEWFYIILQNVPTKPPYILKEESSPLCNLLIDLRNLLFLRQHIFEQCQSKMYILMTAQRSFQYILPLNKRKNAGCILHILHLTDLHIDEKSAQDFYCFFNAIPQIKNGQQIDLVLITGDVIQGRHSASSLEKNYEAAKRFLRKLAYQIWQVDKTHVRSDWRKRIVIIPGNHDYASMNELESSSAAMTGRMTGIGQPSLYEGGAMAKFAYYIDFIRDLLDCDISELILNDLNELRTYSELGLEICELNTVFGAGPLRNNKVWIDEESILNLIQIPNKKEFFRLLLAHHIPCYHPNYLLDRYYVSFKSFPSPELEKQQDWMKKFYEILVDIHNNRGNIDTYNTNPLYSLWNAINQELRDSSSSKTAHLEDIPLGRDIMRILADIKDRKVYTEQIASLYNSVQADWEMSEQDESTLKSTYKRILDCFNAQYILGGHTHSYRYYNDTAKFCELKSPCEIPGVEGHRFLDNHVFHWGILTILDGKAEWAQYSWENGANIKIVDQK